ncbi:unnamed protein product, partial [Rotaria sordida]
MEMTSIIPKSNNFDKKTKTLAKSTEEI